MRCSRCGTEAIPNKKYCTECGNPLSNRCSHRGSDNAPHSKFCADCGSALGKGLGFESARASITETVSGIRIAPEDHPQRALYAALRMQEELKRYSDRLRIEGKLPLQARVGVSTGEAVVRSITTGEGHAEYTPIGHSTGLAAGMQSLAPIGSIAERHSEVELLRVKGELLLTHDAPDLMEVERCYSQRDRNRAAPGGKLFELRAATSFARLLRTQGKTKEARMMLAEIYKWFPEGLDTADLREAKTLHQLGD